MCGLTIPKRTNMSDTYFEDHSSSLSCSTHLRTILTSVVPSQYVLLTSATVFSSEAKNSVIGLCFDNVSSSFSICPEATGLSSVGLSCDLVEHVFIVLEHNDALLICIYNRQWRICIDMSL